MPIKKKVILYNKHDPSKNIDDIILDTLRFWNKPLCRQSLSVLTDITESRISKKLRKLEKFGLVECRTRCSLGFWMAKSKNENAKK